jgi:polyribonucleotide nucleotidyltransferase
MFNIHRKSIQWGGRTLTLETGRIARQADGAIIATYGETVVLCTVVGRKKVDPSVDFFPLGVHYQEKAYAAGKIPGGFFKREGRPTEREVLVSRLIDRPIRPLFPEAFKNETQVICTVLSHDLENDPDILAIIGSSAALTISGLPFLGPVGGARVGYINNQFVLNPVATDMKQSALDLVVAGTSEGVLMVESEAQVLSEQIMLDAVMFGHKAFQPVINMIIELAEECAKDPWTVPEVSELRQKQIKELEAFAEEPLRAAFKERAKQLRQTKIEETKTAARALFQDDETLLDTEFNTMFKNVEKDIVRGDILKTGVRIDGRDNKTVRPIVCETSVLPRTHGSALFTRGETQALVVSTLGTGDDEQIIDQLEGETKQAFMLHYNFPGYSVGEVSRPGSTGRREIGHGKLAWRAIHPLLPGKDKFPYTLRVVSEVTESNGSSSMATVCGTSLALMDAGVPLQEHIAGIAMGLIKEGNDFAVLTDILGDEDHLGDMDFKVAGTKGGITALQMDIKITSINHDIMRIALDQAKDGRLHIIEQMNKALQGSRTSINEHAPRIETIKIHKDKIREVIGSGGKVIRDICETTGAKLEVEDDGTIHVSAVNTKSIDAALQRIRDIVAEPEVGETYDGVVVKIMEFGAFVNFLGGSSGLIHISELAKERVKTVEDVVKVGDHVKFKVIGIDDKGKVRLSMKALLENTEENKQ